MDASSCPRIDGLTPDFFTNLWDIIKEDLLHAYEEIITFGNMSKEYGLGMIHLIPKGGGNANKISRWQPITLVNTVYKVLAKIMACRLAPLLPQLICYSQTRFVKNRSILDNFFLFWEVVDLSKCTNAKVVVVLLDFEKPYDKVYARIS